MVHLFSGAEACPCAKAFASHGLSSETKTRPAAPKIIFFLSKNLFSQQKSRQCLCQLKTKV